MGIIKIVVISTLFVIALVNWSCMYAMGVQKGEHNSLMYDSMIEEEYKEAAAVLEQSHQEQQACNDRLVAAIKLLNNRSFCPNKKEQIIAALEAGADSNAVDNEGRAILLWVARYSTTEIAELLLDRKADIAVKDFTYDGRTPLLWAARVGDTETVQLLLDRKARIDETDACGCTALALAARSEHKDTVQLLLERKAYVNAVNEDGKTPLLWAISNTYHDIAKVLLNNNANVNAVRADGETALLRAVYHDDEAGVELLIAEKADVNVRNSEGDTPLLVALYADNKNMVELLLNAKADDSVVQESLEYSDAALRMAIMFNQTDVVKAILDRGGVVKGKNEQGLTPFQMAYNNGACDIMQLLIIAGAHVPQVSNKRAFFYKQNGIDIIEQACVVRDQIGAQDWIAEDLVSLQFLGVTALELLVGDYAQWHIFCCEQDNKKNLFLEQCAVEHVNRNRARRLAQATAEKAKNRFDEKKASLLRAIRQGRKREVVWLLDDALSVNTADTQGRTVLSLASGANHVKIAQLLLERQASIHEPDSAGNTALWWAVYNGHDQVARILIDHNASLEGIYIEGQTPLAWSATHGREKMVGLLADRAANIDEIMVETVERKNPLLQAIRGDHTQIVQMLLDRKADVTVTDKWGNTPLTVAQVDGHRNIACLLAQNRPGTP